MFRKPVDYPALLTADRICRKIVGRVSIKKKILGSIATGRKETSVTIGSDSDATETYPVRNKDPDYELIISLGLL